MIRHVTGSPSRADFPNVSLFIPMPFAHEHYGLSLACAAEPGGLSTISIPRLAFASRAHHIDIAQ